MKVVIAPDSFKESLSAQEVANAIATGWRTVYPDAQCVCIPIADGGEGTVQSLVDATNGKRVSVEVTAPLGNRIMAEFGLLGDGQCAVIEMSAASGLQLVPVEQRNPLITTTYGTGELIQAALSYQVKKIIVGLGGSATNDGGVGMLQALGARFLDENGNEISWGGEALAHIASIDYSGLDKRLNDVMFEIACDVNNPLCGKTGASAIFAPQKGATREMVSQLDHCLQHYAYCVSRDLEKEIALHAGAGAAGGMGAGLLTLPHAKLIAGAQIVMKSVHLAEHLYDADLVITGEGCMDAQSIRGKTPISVAQLAKKWHKPVIAIVGCVREDYPIVYDYGIDAVLPIIQHLASFDETLTHTRENLISTAQNVARLHRLSGSLKPL